MEKCQILVKILYTTKEMFTNDINRYRVEGLPKKW